MPDPFIAEGYKERLWVEEVDWWRIGRYGEFDLNRRIDMPDHPCYTQSPIQERILCGELRFLVTSRTPKNIA